MSRFKRRRPNPASALPGSPFLTRISLNLERVERGRYPFTVPWLVDDFAMQFPTPVTFLVGENGTGKSTLLEAIAWAVGFSARGGNTERSFTEGADGHALGRALQLAWRQRVSGGFYLRAETFFNFATYLEEVGSTFELYGGRSPHEQSHGESFLALFQHRFEDGLYLLDEPEAALSPQRQLALLRILHQLSAQKIAQFIIATHSPMLLTLPGAHILTLDEGRIEPIMYWETPQYQLTRDFLNDPEHYHAHLFAPEDSEQEQ
jgi:predicted ATPase